MGPEAAARGAAPRDQTGERVWTWGLLLLVAAFAQRLALARVYAPVPYGDTPSYLRLASVVSGLTLEGYDGTRVPGYPAFLAVFRSDPQTVWIAQMGLGIGLSLLIFWVALRTSGSRGLALGLGLLYNLIPGQFLFEANLITETLTAFLIWLALAFWVALQQGRADLAEGKRLAYAAGAGLAAGLAGLVRPLFYLLAPWLLIFIAWAPAEQWGQRAARVLAFTLPSALLLGGWVAYNFSAYGFLAPTVMGGFHLVQHTGSYFEYLPEENAALRDAYIQVRDTQIEERGSQVNAIWDAIPEMSRASGLGFYDLSRELQKLSLQLIREHPDLYLRDVVEGWIAFWKGPVFWNPEAIRAPAVRTALAGMALLGRGVSVAANAAFLALALGSVMSHRVRAVLRVDGYAMATGGLVLATSLIQTLVDHGDNPRFLVPLQMAVFYVVARAAYCAWARRREGEAAKGYA